MDRWRFAVVAEFECLRVIDSVLLLECVFLFHLANYDLFLAFLALVVCVPNLIVYIFFIIVFVGYGSSLSQLAFLLRGFHEAFISV